ncbi:ComF family protein [Acetivibrio clariflavus]|uniref:Putative amidophosphoribosyltransferase n=1 Tax=Acetivibrio clariflavus (strain DSM 19732 / NBRC 101661 / EBR45) TaxID=720554 RepID=G8LTM8_ACECE|nr:ComF family protein [Acetivibrio clariflavus]AEV70538.1 putative amidophosphoribosyltransferase [Acetivibrio clariflavus DSM 19732]
MLERILDLVFPPKCIFCNKILNYGTGICICESCSLNIPYFSEKNLNLIKSNSYFDDIICVCEYSGIIKEALIKYKFFNKPSFGRTFARLIYNRIKEMPDWEEIDLIISVPLHRKKEQIRGYNQSYLIAKQLGKLLGIEVSKNILIRTKNTDSQSLLNRVERLRNVKDAFLVTDVNAIKGKSILVVDDIFTTGSTLNECCRVLKDAGARRITATVIATGRKF